MKLGRPDEARAEFERAAALTRNEPERALTAARARAGAPGPHGRLTPVTGQSAAYSARSKSWYRANASGVPNGSRLL